MKNTVLGIDIGGTNIEAGIVDFDGNILDTISYKTADFPEVTDFATELANQINKLKNSYNIRGIGIGAPTANLFTGQIEYAPNLIWKGIVPLEKIVSQATGLKTRITNDANAVAHAELHFGGGKNLDNFTVLTLGTGLGSGIVVNRQVLYGTNGIAGEIGHTIYDPHGRICNCGRQGCVEEYISIRGIIQTYRELGGNPRTSPKDIYNLAKQGDPIATKTYEITGQILGTKIVDIIHIFDPQAIFLYGGIAHAHDLLIPPALKQIDKQILKAFRGKTVIKPSELLDKKGAVLGAAALIIENL